MDKKQTPKKEPKEKEPCVCGHVEKDHDTPNGTCQFVGDDDCKCTAFEEEEA